MLYYLDYDVVVGMNANHDYSALYLNLHEFQAIRITESQWCFKRINTSAVGLRNFFRSLVHAGDRISVAQVAEWAAYNSYGCPNDLVS